MDVFGLLPHQPQLHELPPSDVAGLAASRIITHKFPLRDGLLEVRLPFDLKYAEAVRLAQFVESMATEA